MKYRSLLTFLMTHFLFVYLYAGEEIRYAADMAHLPAGTDVAALGDAGVVLYRHAISSHWNPAVSGLLDKFELSAEIADLYHGLSNQACFAVHVPVQNQLGVSLLYLPFFSGEIALQDSLEGTEQSRQLDQSLRADGSVKGFFRNNQHLMLLSSGKTFSYSLPRAAGSGYPLPIEFTLGLSTKIYWQTMNPGDIRGLGIGVNGDIGFIGRVGIDYDLVKKEVCREIVIGASIHDILPGKIIWVNSNDNYKEPVQISQFYGISYIDKGDFFPGNWTVVLALKKQYEITWHGGIEAQFWNTVAFRAGLSGKTPTVGAGIHYKYYFIDYAFRFDSIDFSYLRITLGVRF